MIERGSKKWDMMSEFFILYSKWEQIPEGKNEETLLDETIVDMVDFCRKYVEKNDRFAANIAAALFLQVDDMINGRKVLGADKGALRITAMWFEKLSREKGDESNGIS